MKFSWIDLCVVFLLYSTGRYIKESRYKDEHIPGYLILLSLCVSLAMQLILNERTRLADICEAALQAMVYASVAITLNQLLVQRRKGKSDQIPCRWHIR